MDAVQVASILVSMIAAAAAIASQRAAAKASTRNAETSAETERTKSELAAEVEREKNRLEAEKDAYTRARTMDIQTIERQGAEIAEVREQNLHLNEDVKRVARDNEELHRENNRLREEVQRLRTRVRRLEGRGDDDHIRTADHTQLAEPRTDTPDAYHGGPEEEEDDNHRPPNVGGIDTEPMVRENTDGQQ